MSRCAACQGIVHHLDLNSNGVCLECAEAGISSYLRTPHVSCPNCSGTGIDPQNRSLVCDWCDGYTTVTTLTLIVRPHILPLTTSNTRH